jgi:heme/copper-type cytochrome/quinol oxidase subunit 2
MNLGLMIYLMDVVDNIDLLFFIIAVIFMLFVIILSVGLLADDGLKWTEYKKIYTISFIAMCIFIVLVIIIPSSKTLAAMYLLPKMNSNEQIQEMPSKVLTIFNAKLDEWINNVAGKDKDTGNRR